MMMNAPMMWQCGTPVEYFSASKERWINASVKSWETDGAVELFLDSGRGRSGLAHVSHDKINSKVRAAGGRYHKEDNSNDLHSPEPTYEIQATLKEEPSFAQWTPRDFHEPRWTPEPCWAPSAYVAASPTASNFSFTPKSDWSELEVTLPRERDPDAMRAILLQGYKSTKEFPGTTPKWGNRNDEESASTGVSTADGSQSNTSSAGDLHSNVANREKAAGKEAKGDRFREAKTSEEDGNSKTRQVAVGLHECLVLKGFKNNKPNLLMDVAMAIWADIGSETPGKAELERLANILAQHSDLFTVVNKPVLRHSRTVREQDTSTSPFSQTACLIRVL
jgi:hypothetical protein